MTHRACRRSRPSEEIDHAGDGEAVLHRIQQLTVDRAMFAPIWHLRALMDVSARVADPAINLVPNSLFPSYEDEPQ